MYCCSKEKETCVLLFLGEDNMYTTGFREWNWCSTVSGEGIWCCTAHVFRRSGLVLCCSLEKGDGLYLSV